MYPKTYMEASALLKDRCKDRRKLANNTYLERRKAKIVIRLHNTDIVIFSTDGTVTLNTGGWRTVTTKERINRYIAGSIWTNQGVWFYKPNGWRSPNSDPIYGFEDQMAIDEKGIPRNLEPRTSTKQTKEQKELLKKIKKFAQLCALEIPGNKPGPGDCWFCSMKIEGGRTLGEVSSNRDHLISHMEEGYVVPSLVYSACKRFGVSQVAMMFVTGQDPKGWYVGIGQKQVYKAVYRYMKERFGFSC